MTSELVGLLLIVGAFMLPVAIMAVWEWASLGNLGRFFYSMSLHTWQLDDQDLAGRRRYSCRRQRCPARMTED